MSLENQKLREFLQQQGFDENSKIEAITNSASQRRYYRIFQHGTSFILTQSENIAENNTFLYYTQCFEKVPLNVPKILAVSEDHSIYLQEDLGDESLLSFIQNHKDLESYFEKIMSDLASMQVQLPKYIDFKKSYEFQNFDEKIILNDLFYFKNYFLEYLEIPFQKQKLIEDFIKISKEIDLLPHDFFMYRDFQSRNIMMFEERPYYIDYQGGLQGIACYDLVSFSWQAKADFSLETKENLKMLYFSNIQNQSEISLDELEKSYNISLVLRLFQLLGAYGFRGLVQGKSHFKESIQKALQNVQYLVENQFIEDYPELHKISSKYLIPDKLNI